ncbi:MAG TPA: ATP-binding protein [Gemmatales bacterium]|nr:ATP-binding protein [Gemmatales bacterium]
MSLRYYPTRLFFFAVGTSLVMLVFCFSLAAYLYSQQSISAEILGENIGSRGAALNLEVTLNDLLALHQRGAEQVEALWEKVQLFQKEIEEFADKPEEQVIAGKLRTDLNQYRVIWTSKEAIARKQIEAIAILQNKMIPSVQALRNFNGDQLRDSEAKHRTTLRHMAWGLAIVGGMGSLAGLVFGYGLARSLRFNLDQLLIRVQGASDKLNQESPVAEVVESPQGLQELSQSLVVQVENVVEKLQQREREVRRAEQLASVGQLASGIAHEIRNPLTSVKLLVQCAQHDSTNAGLSKDDLQLMESEIRRIEQSIQTFLDYARPPRLERSMVNLADVATEGLQLIRGKADQQQVQVVTRFPADPITLSVDGLQLRQVFVNLFLNSIDAMPTGGTLTLTISSPTTDAVECKVEDTGKGIPPDIQVKLFQPFVTSKETGIGLGLVVSQRIINEHGGTLQGSNREAGGACFQIRLPSAKLSTVSSPR